MSKVLLIASFAPSLVNFRGPLIRALVGLGHEVHVAAPGVRAIIAASELASIVTAHDTPVDRTGTGLMANLREIAVYRQLIRRIRPAHVLCYTIKPVVLGTLAARLERVPHRTALLTGLGYVFESASLRARMIRLAISPLYRAALGGAEMVIFQNPDDEATLRRLRLVAPAQRSIVVSGSGIDLERFLPVPLAEGRVVLLIARLVKAKGILDFVAAARIVRSRDPRIVFRLAGWFDDANPVAISRSEVAEWVREGTIEYLGALEDVRPALAACTVFCLPSYYEGTPRTVLEALATGRPIVTTDVPGCRETVRDGWNGYLVPPHDPAGLADAILKLLGDRAETERMADASLSYARDRYDVNKVNADMVEGMGLAA
ncbi:glycosyl transferase [Polymorphobacter multimanifer]|uniref:Glycosyltransferase involved in cell wall biosynthesis n=1 Tax=Polymorphobacter multimanifer TaxID=1070431 RepID=A0A841L7X4_9SPHN|nr:glycosyltransferase family 4 protein [Polymorphobacter multimanifer]MBB6228540.1 glycosyltransferase involved in cell wall biosynthesis [Polymorphobacter multimanifer]GGI75382.1 glycosyl transferase [Polymorphobacter multimanifer]